MIDPNYAQPDALVTLDWLATHLNEPNTRLVESNEDILLYSIGHIPGAVHIDWRADLQDQTMRDYISPKVFAELCAKNGITKSTTVIFYGDKSNWWSCYALWAFRLFGHEKVKIVDGGRDKWIAETRPLTREVPSYPRSEYPLPAKRNSRLLRRGTQAEPGGKAAHRRALARRIQRRNNSYARISPGGCFAWRSHSRSKELSLETRCE